MSVPDLTATGFGWLVADGTRYEDDLVITPEGEIRPREKKLSKKYGGGHTVLGPEELENLLAANPEILLVASGHFDQLPIRPEVLEHLNARGIQLERVPTPDAPARYRALIADGKRVAAVFHLTC